MAGSSPRLSGLFSYPYENALGFILDWPGLGWSAGSEALNGVTVEQVGADHAGKAGQGFVALIGLVGKSEQYEGDQSDCDLDANGIFAEAVEVAQLQRLLD